MLRVDLLSSITIIGPLPKATNNNTMVQSGNYCRRGSRATTVGCDGGDDDGFEGSLKTAIGNRISEVDGRRVGDVGGHGFRKDGPRRPVVGTTRWSLGRWRAGHDRPGRREEGRERRLQNDRGGKGEEGDARRRVVVFRPVDFLNSTFVVSPPPLLQIGGRAILLSVKLGI